MWAKPTKSDLEKLAKNRANPKKTKDGDTIILAHFFMGGNDWYVTDYDPETEVMFCYAVINGNLQFAEWGTVFYQEDPNNPASKGNNLMDLKHSFVEVDFDKHFKPTPFKEILAELNKRYGQ